MIFNWTNDSQLYFIGQGLITIGLTGFVTAVDYAYFELKLIRGRAFESILTSRLQANLGLTKRMNTDSKREDA